MSERYPGYDVLAKRESPSWNEQTRAVVDKRLATDPETHRFFTDQEWPTINAVCARIIPQPEGRTRKVPLAALVDEKMHSNGLDGFRDVRLPRMQEAWRRGLAALDAEARQRGARGFHELEPEAQDALLKAVQQGGVSDPAWGDMPPKLFFAQRVLHDIVSAYYADPHAWNEVGFGGPASPRGYVRMNYDRRDPWEAAEAKPGREEQARKENARVR